MTVSPFPDDQSRPVPYRVGSEHTNPESIHCRTSDNQPSIFVALIENLAARVTPSGYRLLFKRPQGDRYYSYASHGRRTFDLQTRGEMLAASQWLVSEAHVTLGTAARLEAAMAVWPEHSVSAWYALNNGPASRLPPYAPSGMTVALS